MSAVFDRIYRENAWNGVESMSGPGSGSAATRRVAEQITSLVAELGITSVLDVGCGDGYWMPDLPGYLGIDLSREAIRLARQRHPRRMYEVDRGHGLPMVDLIICRDVMQHLPPKDGGRLIDRFIASGSTYLLASTYVGGETVEIEAGDSYSPDLTKFPFSCPGPLRLIFDGYYYHEHDTDQVRDARKHLGLWRLP